MSRVHSVCTSRHGPSRSGAPMAQGAPGAVGLQSLPAKAGEGEEAMPIRGSAGVTPWFSEKFKTYQVNAFHLNSNMIFFNNYGMHIFISEL
jgi:hypothetical protein